MAPTVSIVIPAFNEAARIGNTIQKVRSFLETFPFSYELIIVDDGSADETPVIVERHAFRGLRLVRNGVNHGKGFAVKQGILAATGDYVLFSDADLSAPIEEIEKLLDVATQDHADVVIGSRAVDRSMIGVHQSTLREAGGIIFNMLVQLTLGLRLHDTQCGFKLFDRKRVLSIFEKQRTSGFGFDPEVLFLAARQGLKIREVPVRWNHAEGSKIRFFQDGVGMFLDLVRIRWNYMRGRYS